ncbi:MAG: 50S ribosomal protein L10 [Candidatus Dormibacteria bacterium]
MGQVDRRGAAVVPQTKQDQVAELAEKLGRMRSAVLSDYRGLSVAELEELRSGFREAAVDFLVLKNTLARRAGEKAGVPQLTDALVGPNAVAIGYDDPALPARLLVAYARANRRPEMVLGGIAEGQLLGPQEVRQLAELPSREVLMAQLLGVVESAVGQLVQLLESPVRDLVGLLEAKAQATPEAPARSG